MLRNKPDDYEKVYAEATFTSTGGRVSRQYLAEVDAIDVTTELSANSIAFADVDPDDIYTKYEASAPTGFRLSTSAICTASTRAGMDRPKSHDFTYDDHGDDAMRTRLVLGLSAARTRALLARQSGAAQDKAPRRPNNSRTIPCRSRSTTSSAPKATPYFGVLVKVSASANSVTAVNSRPLTNRRSFGLTATLLLFLRGVRPRCGAGDDHPARRRQAIPITDGGESRPLRAAVAYGAG